jgi:hypothetical protein
MTEQDPGMTLEKLTEIKKAYRGSNDLGGKVIHALIAEIERLWNRDFKTVGKEALAKAIDPNAALVTKLSALLVEMEVAGFEIAVETNTHMQTWQEWEAHPVAVIKVKNCEVGYVNDPTSLRYLCLPE